jgi:hypothetical protein
MHSPSFTGSYETIEVLVGIQRAGDHIKGPSTSSVIQHSSLSSPVIILDGMPFSWVFVSLVASPDDYSYPMITPRNAEGLPDKSTLRHRSKLAPVKSQTHSKPLPIHLALFLDNAESVTRQSMVELHYCQSAVGRNPKLWRRRANRSD